MSPPPVPAPASRPQPVGGGSSSSPRPALGGNVTLRAPKISHAGAALLILLGVLLASQVLFGDLGTKLFNWINYYRGVAPPVSSPPVTQAAPAAPSQAPPVGTPYNGGGSGSGMVGLV